MSISDATGLKVSFAHTTNQIDPYLPKGLSDCEEYGMWYGCDEHCPVLIEGKCELQETENKHLYELVKIMSKEIYCGECKNLLYEDACGYGECKLTGEPCRCSDKCHLTHGKP